MAFYIVKEKHLNCIKLQRIRIPFIKHFAAFIILWYFVEWIWEYEKFNRKFIFNDQLLNCNANIENLSNWNIMLSLFEPLKSTSSSYQKIFIFVINSYFKDNKMAGLSASFFKGSSLRLELRTFGWLPWGTRFKNLSNGIPM